MGDRYAATGSNTVTASPGDTVLAVLANATIRGRVYDIMVSHAATPADNVIEWLVRRLTAVGTEGAGVTPIALDPGAPAALLDGAEDHTVEPTYTAASELLDLDFNQRASFRWVAAPGGELVVPATANNGIGVTPISAAYSGDARAVAHWEE